MAGTTGSAAETLAASSTAEFLNAQQLSNARLVADACDRWWDDEEFEELPLDVLENCGVLDRNDAYLMHFVASNFFELAQFQQAAECFVDSFRQPQSRRFDYRDFMRQELWIRYRQDLDSLLSSDDRESTERLIAEFLQRHYDEREATLAAHRERTRRAREAPRLPNLAFSAALSYLMQQFPMETVGVAANSPALHLVLFYADALCIHHFNHRLFEADNPPIAAGNGLLYRSAGETGLDEGTSPIIPEHERLLRASFKAVGLLTGAGLDGALRREPIWMATARNRALTVARIRRFFHKHTDFSKSPTFQRVCEVYASLELSSKLAG